MCEFYINEKDKEAFFIKESTKTNQKGIIFIGGTGTFVSEEKSDLHQKKERLNLLQKLAEEGYTIAYSNAFNRNWGSERAVRNIKDIKELLKKKYGMDEINIIATSMGCVLGLNILREEKDIKQMIAIKPVFDLEKHKKYVNIREGIDRIAREQQEAYTENETFNKEGFETNTKITIIHGEKDDVAPFENNKEFLAKINAPIKVIEIKKANHQDDHLFFDSELYKDFFN